MCIRKFLFAVFIALLLMLSVRPSVAEGPTPAAKVTYLRSNISAFSFTLQGVPAGCSAGGGQFYVNWNSANAKQMYALVMAAYETGKLISVLYYGCNSTYISGAADVLDIDSRQ